MPDATPPEDQLAGLAARVQALEDLEAIRELKHRYFRLLDHQQWDELRECFTDDVHTAYEAGHYAFDGIEETMRFLSESLGGLRAEGRLSLHMGHHPELELTSETTATGRWTLHSVAVQGSAERSAQLGAHYFDEYRKVDGEWRISKTGYDPVFHSTSPTPGIQVRSGEELDSRGMNTRARARAD